MSPAAAESRPSRDSKSPNPLRSAAGNLGHVFRSANSTPLTRRAGRLGHDRLELRRKRAAIEQFPISLERTVQIQGDGLRLWVHLTRSESRSVPLEPQNIGVFVMRTSQWFDVCCTFSSVSRFAWRRSGLLALIVVTAAVAGTINAATATGHNGHTSF